MAARSLEIGACEEDPVRPLRDVLNRTLTLGAAVAAACGAPRDELLAWLTEMALVDELTARERKLLNQEAVEQLAIDLSWQSERLVVLLWALNKIPAIPFPAPKVSAAFIEELLPPYGDEPAAQFCASARLRSEDELFAAALEIQELHVVARQRRLSQPDYRPSVPELDAEVIQERHHAINWLVGYCRQSWDEIATDT
jgi:hypothetical protein